MPQVSGHLMLILYFLYWCHSLRVISSWAKGFWATYKVPHLLLFNRSAMSDSATPWTAARQASLSITNSWSLLKLMSIELVMPSNHLVLCLPLLLLLSIFPSIRVFSDELSLSIEWPKYWKERKWSRSVMFNSAIPWTVVYQDPPCMGFSRQEYWSGLPSPSPKGILDAGIKAGSPTW